MDKFNYYISAIFIFQILGGVIISLKNNKTAFPHCRH